MSGAAHHRHSSKQDYRTPDDFRLAVIARFGGPSIDLACERGNKFGVRGITRTQDSFTVNWHEEIGDGLGWLNPEYSNIGRWAEQCAFYAANRPGIGLQGSRILLLVPASIGSNWFRDFVYPFAHTLALNGRLSFDGKNPYPKDLILALYNITGYATHSMSLWTWK